jgi:hypothetical protein
MTGVSDRDLTVTVTDLQQSFDFYHEDCMISGSADFDTTVTDLLSSAAMPTLTVDDISPLSIDWSAMNSSIMLGPLMSDTIGDANLSVNHSRISLTGNDADIEINGESVMGVLKEIRDRLGILKVSETMEAEWDELRELRQQYEAKLAECREKSEAWSALKQMPPPRIP